MSESETQKSNVPEFSVQELAFSLKKTLEDTYARVRVRGELSRVSVASSGHMYSSLKDDKAVIDAICWKGTLAKLALKPEEGLEVICTGRISTYPARSNYQLIIEHMELAGEGALLKMLEERKRKLAAEGLFDAERKKPLPFLPDVIGVVTSPTGAVIRDIMHRLEDRFPRHVLLYPALVQGKGAAEQIAQGIRTFQSIGDHGFPTPDVIIVARGGGSLEDLMPFNEEIVVRAVAESRIPVISAVGHETDTTLCDYAADARAPTPTGAAEIAVPVRAQLRAQILDDSKRMVAAMDRLLSEKKNRVDTAVVRLGDPAHSLESHAQRLDFVSGRMSGAFKHFLGEKQQRLIRSAARIRAPQEQVRAGKQTLNQMSVNLGRAMSALLDTQKKTLHHTGKMLEAYGFENTLKRGFVIARTKSGDLIADKKAAQKAEVFDLQFAGEGMLEVTSAGRSKSSIQQKDDKPATKLKSQKLSEKEKSAQKEQTKQASLF